MRARLSLAGFVAGAVALVASGCGNGGTSKEEPVRAAAASFDPGPVAPGYVRYSLPPIDDIAPNTEGMWCQWLTGPVDRDTDITGIRAAQAKHGHHVVLYATPPEVPAGTTRPCNGTSGTDDLDMTRYTFLGGTGGAHELENAPMPEGMVMRVPAGKALMAQVHYVNYEESKLKGEAVVDLAVEPAKPERTVATFFSINAMGFGIPPRAAYSADVRCTLTRDVDLVMFANHLHEMGVHVRTTIERPDGTAQVLVDDPKWPTFQTFHPRFEVWPASAPKKVRAGDVMHLHCDWQNTTDDVVTFPREMCVGLGYFGSSGDAPITCLDGAWLP